MAKEFPFIKSMDIQAHAGVSMIHADIPWLPKKVPVSAISSGVHKLLVLLLAIAEHKRNAIFIDEIENNFHYSLFDSLWRLLIDVCAKQETQLFVSTHSKECLEALAAALSAAKRQDDASLIRSTLDDDGNVAIEQFVGLEAARYGEVR
jgi:predicted ATPase